MNTIENEKELITTESKGIFIRGSGIIYSLDI